MFESLDKNVDGTINLEEFSTALKRRNLEKLFPREQQRVIFEAIDKDHSETLGVEELINFLDDDARPGGADAGDIPLPKDGGVVGRAVREHGVDALRLVEKSQLPPNLRDIKDKIIDAIFSKTRGENLEEGSGKQTEYLMNTFKQWDKDMSGELSPREIVNALGPGHLNLGLRKRDVRELVDFLDLDNDGTISYKEFVRFLELTDIEPDYNPSRRPRGGGKRCVAGRPGGRCVAAPPRRRRRGWSADGIAAPPTTRIVRGRDRGAADDADSPRTGSRRRRRRG